MTCEKVGRGRRSIPLPNASQKICITTASWPCMVCAAASAFLLYRAVHACVYAAGFVSRSAHFVFTGQRAPVEAETGFFAPCMVARSANGNGRLGRLEIASSLFSFLSLPDCVHPRSPGEKGPQGVTGESRGHIFLYSWSGDSGIALKQTTTWKGMVVSKRIRCIRPSLETKNTE